MATSEVKVEPKNNDNDNNKSLMRPGEMESSQDLCMLEDGASLGLSVPDERSITEYFRKPETLAADRKKKDHYDGGDGAESYEK